MSDEILVPPNLYNPPLPPINGIYPPVVLPDVETKINYSLLQPVDELVDTIKSPSLLINDSSSNIDPHLNHHFIVDNRLYLSRHPFSTSQPFVFPPFNHPVVFHRHLYNFYTLIHFWSIVTYDHFSFFLKMDRHDNHTQKSFRHHWLIAVSSQLLHGILHHD